MEFAELISDAKSLREKVQNSPVPFLPPTLHCYLAGESIAGCMANKSDEVTLAGMFGLIPASGADEVFVGVEAFVRPIDVPAEGPLSEDPWAQPAVILLHVAVAGDLVETSINPYSISETGQVEWAEPGAVTTPLITKLTNAIQELFGLDVTGKAVARDLCNWMLVNGYSVRVHPSVVQEVKGDGGEEA